MYFSDLPPGVEGIAIKSFLSICSALPDSILTIYRGNGMV